MSRVSLVVTAILSVGFWHGAEISDSGHHADCDWVCPLSAQANSDHKLTFQLAQAVDQFPPNPLTVELDIPQPRIGAAELRRQLAALNQGAIGQLQAGDAKAAFTQWNRALRLSRALGPAEETKALAQVGEIAWERNNTQQVRYIRQRLQQIQADQVGDRADSPASTPTDSQPVLTELAAAYQLIRAPELALQVYDRMLAAAKTDATDRFQLFNRVAQTHLDWFDYKQAARVYQQLLQQAQERDNPVNQIAFAYQLAYVYEQAKQPAGAVGALEILIPLYAQQPEPLLLADFQTRLAKQYQLNRQVQLAEQTYQSAYRTAEAQEQVGFAGDALRQLAGFYRQQQRWSAAAQVYDFLTTFEQETGLNLYNAMDAYDQLGQVWLAEKNQTKAIAAFEQGLQLAQQLDYREQYFRDRLAKLAEGITASP